MNAADFIEGLTDAELAYVFIYKRLRYLPERQGRIEEEVAKRNIPVEALAGLATRPLTGPEAGGCGLCGSLRGAVDAECVICGYREGTNAGAPSPAGPSWWDLPAIVLDIGSLL